MKSRYLYRFLPVVPNTSSPNDKPYQLTGLRLRRLKELKAQHHSAICTVRNSNKKALSFPSMAARCEETTTSACPVSKASHRYKNNKTSYPLQLQCRIGSRLLEAIDGGRELEVNRLLHKYPESIRFQCGMDVRPIMQTIRSGLKYTCDHGNEIEM